MVTEVNAVDYGFAVGDVVNHVKDASATGVVTEIDTDFDLGGVTTCRVLWDVGTLEEAHTFPYKDQDVQWTNKLARVE